MLNESGGKGELIVLSDGILQNYPDVVKHSVQLITDECYNTPYSGSSISRYHRTFR